MRKFKVKVNGKEYVVEIEEIKEEENAKEPSDNKEEKSENAEEN